MQDASDTVEHEQNHSYKVNDGRGFVAHAIRADEGSGIISVDGAAANRAGLRDIVIICAYAQIDQAHLAKFKPTPVYVNRGDSMSHAKNSIAKQRRSDEQGFGLLSLLLCNRPFHMFANQRGWMVTARIQGVGDCPAWRCVAQRHGDIAQPAFMPYAADRRSFGALEKLVFAPGEQPGERRRIQAVARNEILLDALARKFVPGTDQLAIVAAVNAVAEQWPQFERNAAAQFDGEIGNAASRVELLRADDGLRGAYFNAAHARAAMIGRRRVHRQGQVGEQLAEKKPGARTRIEQVGVLADPAESGIARQGFFQHRGRVDKCAVTEGADRFTDSIGEFLQSIAHQLVVIATQRVTRYVTKSGVIEHLPGIVRRGRVVVHAHRYDAYGSWMQFGRPTAFDAVTLHVIHVAVVPGSEPVQQMRLVAIEIRGGYSDLLKAQLAAPATNVRGKSGIIDSVHAISIIVRR